MHNIVTSEGKLLKTPAPDEEVKVQTWVMYGQYQFLIPNQESALVIQHKNQKNF